MNASHYFNGIITLIPKYEKEYMIIEIINNLRYSYKGRISGKQPPIEGKYILHVWDLVESVSGGPL